MEQRCVSPPVFVSRRAGKREEYRDGNRGDDERVMLVVMLACVGFGDAGTGGRLAMAIAGKPIAMCQRNVFRALSLHKASAPSP